MHIAVKSPRPPAAVYLEGAIWEGLSDFQLGEGGVRGKRPSVPTILSGVVAFDPKINRFRKYVDLIDGCDCTCSQVICGLTFPFITHADKRIK